MKSILAFVCLAAFISIINAETKLSCYKCESDKLDGCYKSQKPKEEECGKTLDTHKNVCVYIVSHDDQKKMDKVEARCEQIGKDQKLDKSSIASCTAPPAGYKNVECRVCDSNLCNNSAFAIGSSMVTLMCLPLAYLVSKYMF